ncbi:MAG TPA: hypothetical protein GX524_03650, partial [Firmicutes bacterium]|nr:hypothetical protein [Bacillota bacterium]
RIAFFASKIVLEFHHNGLRLMERGVKLEKILEMKVRERIARARVVPEKEWPQEFEGIMAAIRDELRDETH